MKVRFTPRDKELIGDVVKAGQTQRRHRGRLAKGMTEYINVQVEDQWHTVYHLRADRDDWEELS